jgi:uncharacterized protein
MTRSDERFNVLASALADAGSPLSAAELHGGLCGALCAAGPEAGAAWLDRCAQECGPQAAFGELLDTLHRESWRALTGTEMEFAPLLPHDSEALAARVQALASWCNGFVVGLGLGGLHLDADAQANEEILEIVRDFIEIGKADVDAETESDVEEAESSYAEVAEFVRVGVQIVFEEIGPTRSGDGALVH